MWIGELSFLDLDGLASLYNSATSQARTVIFWYSVNAGYSGGQFREVAVVNAQEPSVRQGSAKDPLASPLKYSTITG